MPQNCDIFNSPIRWQAEDAPPLPPKAPPEAASRAGALPPATLPRGLPRDICGQKKRQAAGWACDPA